MFDLIKVVGSAGETLYTWLRNGEALADKCGFIDLMQAKAWFVENYAIEHQGPDHRSNVDRRDGYDRRRRITDFDRRQRPQGRRWTDEIARYS